MTATTKIVITTFLGSAISFAGGFVLCRQLQPPRANVYINRFDCSKEGAREARELKEEILRQQREAGR